MRRVLTKLGGEYSRDLACRNESIARGVEKLQTVRFLQKYELTWHMYHIPSVEMERVTSLTGST